MADGRNPRHRPPAELARGNGAGVLTAPPLPQTLGCMKSISYALGADASAARRLEIQDAQFAAISERVLDRLNVQPADRVLELGIGAGSFSRRIVRRLGPDGTFVGVDYS